MPRLDPIESLVEEGLQHLRTKYLKEVPVQGRALDFYLPTLDVYIECKQFHSDRIAKQMKVVDNVIVIQGIKAASCFKALCMSMGALDHAP